MLVKVTIRGIVRFVETMPTLPAMPDPPVPVPSVLPDASTRQIMDIVSKHFNVPLYQLVGNGRTAKISRARRVGMYLARRVTGNSFPVIARMFGRDNHTTVVSACQAVEADPELLVQVGWLEKKMDRPMPTERKTLRNVTVSAQ